MCDKRFVFATFYDIFFIFCMHYYFNFELLSRLHQCFNMTRKELAKKTGIDYLVIYRALNNPKIELRALLRLCNIVGMPIGYFFRTDDAPAPLPVPPSNFVPAEMNEEYLLSLFAGADKCPLQMSMREVHRCIGVPESKKSRRIHKHATVTAQQVVDWCNALYVNLDCIINDPMAPIAPIYDVKNVEIRRLMIKNRQEITKLMREKEALEAQNKQLEAENRELKESESIGIAATPCVEYISKKR